MFKKKHKFPFFTFSVCVLAIVMIAFIGYFVFNVLTQAPEIVFRSRSAQKPYDGTALTDDFWQIDSGELKDGHSVDVTFYGTQTRIGTSKNIFKVKIYDENGKDVTRDYMIIYDYGFLTVYLPTDETHPQETPEGGGEGSSSGGGEGGGQNMIYVRAPRSDVVYLRHKSYGNFTGVDWNERIESYANKNAENPLTYLSYAISENTSLKRERIDIRSGMGVTYTPYHFNNDEGLCDADDRVLPYSGSEYSIHYYYLYDVSKLKKLSLSGTAVESEEKMYRSYVKENYLTLSSEEKTKFLQLAEAAGIRAGDEDVIEKVADYIMNAATYNLDYKPYPSDVNHALYFLLHAKEGVCVQYATSATLMFRALGIPARYVTGYMGHTQAGEWAGIDSAIGHAWTEVYLDGLGWIPVEATPPSGSGEEGNTSGGTGGGGDEGNLNALELTPVYASKKYDGTALKPTNFLTGFENWEELGYSYVAEVSGSQTKIGYGESIIESVKIFDPDMVNVTDQFVLYYNTGILHVYRKQIRTSSLDIQKYYDGQPISLNNFKCIDSVNNGHTLDVVFTAPTVVGKYVNSYDITAYDIKGEDVSYYYEFIYDYGELIIAPLSIGFTPLDAEKTYDGTALTATEYEMTGDLLEGHIIESLVLTGSQTEVGRSYSRVSEIIITDKEGNDVTQNYVITLGTGLLTVTAE